MSATGVQEVLCVNGECRKKIGDRVKFCPYCRTLQPLNETDSAAGSDHGMNGSASASGAPPFHPTAATNRGASAAGVSELVLRASSGVWDFTEREENVTAGQRRPLLVLDEQTVHLSHTDRKLNIQELLQRVRAIIDANEVPVLVQQGSARWQSDRGEMRSRIVASLKDHAYSDYKMIFGVDYMGRWASIKMYLAVEPPILPPVPTPKPPPAFMPILAIVLAIIGILTIMIVIGIGFLIGAFFAWKSAKQKYDDEQRGARHQYEHDVAQQREEIEAQAQRKNLMRTYKIDDMRLFASAMNVVFQAVVDDIVQKDGAKIERIEGGKGGFLTEEGITSIVSAPRQSDAKALGL